MMRFIDCATIGGGHMYCLACLSFESLSVPSCMRITTWSGL